MWSVGTPHPTNHPKMYGCESVNNLSLSRNPERISKDIMVYSTLLWHASPRRSLDKKYRSLITSREDKTMVNATVSCMATESMITDTGKMANAVPDHLAFSTH